MKLVGDTVPNVEAFMQEYRTQQPRDFPVDLLLSIMASTTVQPTPCHQQQPSSTSPSPEPCP
ncbi:hypothetical protein JCM21900_004454 [Sporobolomyces salmonicolor]